ncbi:MAG: MgtC/SapB family protein [Lachnospiraceae bacterium]|nr:MgtC/SapB family protein [Lachnospiraceae bacterium]MBR6526793.1 MgtC/SapB family protein [Lachnospiraceae bacterium]
MLSIFDGLRDITFATVALRMFLAMFCGGCIGLEREFKRRSAGFRTHILICLGATMTTSISQFLYLYMGYYTDMARLGAQVVAGIGFIGVGAIVTTPQKRVKGLTTAAGLWASAIIGLCLGAGFYEGALLATILILIAELVLSPIEHKYMDRTPEVNLYMEYNNKATLDNVLFIFRQMDIKVVNLEITRATENERHNASAIFLIRLNRRFNANKVVDAVRKVEGVFSIYEI